MSWGEDERTDSQREWRERRKCYYCSELVEKKLTTLEKGTAFYCVCMNDDKIKRMKCPDRKITLEGRIVCKTCFKHVCFFCGQHKPYEHFIKTNGHMICSNCAKVRREEGIIEEDMC